jgi:hypothetical protein
MAREKKLLEGEMRTGREANRPIFKTNDGEWAAAVSSDGEILA